jgi:acyl-CoA synthetase (AMP-forming)/AMP-acid ligase II
MDIIGKFESIVRNNAEHTAFIDGRQPHSFATLQTDSQAVSERLNQLGIKPGSRCLVSTENSYRTATTILGIWYTNAIPVLLNHQSPFHHLQHAATQTKATAIVSDTSDDIMISVDGQDLLAINLLDIAQPTQKLPAPASKIRPSISASDIASIVFTSGSTGLPKGVAQSHQSLINACQSVYSCLGYRPGDRILCPVPWSFDYGFGQLLTTMLTGITQLIPENPNPFNTGNLIEQEKPTVLAGVPSLLASMCSGIGADKLDLSSVRLITSTGSKVSRGLLDSVQDLFPGAGICLNYGLTETYRSACLNPGLVDSHGDSVGRAISGVDLVVVRPDGSLAEPNEIGEIVHRGQGLFSGYWGDPDSTAKVLKSDPCPAHTDIKPAKVVFTGDLGWKDDEGFLYIKGRKDRMIKSMGVRVSPDDIETQLRNYIQISDVAVLSKSDEIMGEKIVAVFVAKNPESFELKNLKKFCRTHLSPYMQPREFHQVAELPRTTSSKTDYVALNSSYSQ